MAKLGMGLWEWNGEQTKIHVYRNNIFIGHTNCAALWNDVDKTGDWDWDQDQDLFARNPEITKNANRLHLILKRI